jgi:hypothetical protein
MSTDEHPTVVAEIGDREMRLLLDTGYSGGLALEDLSALPLESRRRDGVRWVEPFRPPVSWVVARAMAQQGGGGDE